MIEVREMKVIDIDKLVTKTEDTVVKTIRLAKASLTGIKLRVGVLKFKDGPHLDDRYIK